MMWMNYMKMEPYQRVPKPSDSCFLITFSHQRIQKKTALVNLYENIISGNGFRWECQPSMLSIFTCVSNRLSMTSSYIHLSISFSLSPNLTNLKHQVILCEHGMHNNTISFVHYVSYRCFSKYVRIIKDRR